MSAWIDRWPWWAWYLVGVWAGWFLHILWTQAVDNWSRTAPADPAPFRYPPGAVDALLREARLILEEVNPGGDPAPEGRAAG